MTRENLVGNLLTHIFLSADPPTIDPNPQCGRRLRGSLRLIGGDDGVKSPTLLTDSRRSDERRRTRRTRLGPQTSDRQTFRRDHWWASVPHRSDACEQPLACPVGSEARHAHGHDALLRPDPRGGGPPAGRVAVARASPPHNSAGCCARQLGLASNLWTARPCVSVFSCGLFRARPAGRW